MTLLEKGIESELARFFAEDDFASNSFYLENLPVEQVRCNLKIKSDMVLSGMPYFIAAFNYLGAQLKMKDFSQYEGKNFQAGEIISFELPFALALTGERVALNLLQRSSAVSTITAEYVKKVKDSKLKIKILDTRKTTPGLRNLEKYAVRVGGGFNHRFSQADVWMIKDNHKNIFKGLTAAFHFFNNMQTHYRPIIAEIHNLTEFDEAIRLGIKHVMLDNFSIDEIKSAIVKKVSGMTIEISGGVNLSNIQQYCIEGVDAISIGALTHSAPHVDLSLKYFPIGNDK